MTVNMRLLIGGLMLVAFHAAADNLHWKGAGGNGSGDFDVAANWSEGKVPGAADLAAFNNQANANWAIALTGGDVSNTTISIIAPPLNYETLFNLSQHVWSATNVLNLWQGAGGKVTVSNGTLRISQLLNCQMGPASGQMPTNLAIVAFQNVRSVSANAFFAGLATSFEGGEHTVANQVKVGTLTEASASAILILTTLHS